MILPTSQISQDSIEQRMLRELNKALDENFLAITEQIVSEAKQQFEKELRAKLGTIACSLASYYSVERMGGNLIIRVQLNSGETK